jgi:arylsulfatase A-like enzyme
MRCFSKAATTFCLALAGGAVMAAPSATPDVLLITVDTLRADHVSAYGYSRNTTPEIDKLLAGGVRFSQARTVEPLTGPALSSMVTSLYPHEHGSTRNGLRIRENLASFPRLMARRGYETAAFLGNWTLRDALSGLAEHFDTYDAVLTRKRWFGMLKSEATADDLNGEAIEWLDQHFSEEPRRPFLLWVHYVEPHAPYGLRNEYLEQVGLGTTGSFFSPRNRYDTEIAYVDKRIGDLLADVRGRVDPKNLIVVFASDHGESLGDHGYWGHGRHLYEPTLWIPMGITWAGKVFSGPLDAPALIVDLAPTLLGLLGIESPAVFRGFDWSKILTQGGQLPMDRVTFFQTHRTAVEPQEDQTALRRKGLLEVGRIVGRQKELLRVKGHKHRAFDLLADPKEESSKVGEDSEVSAPLLEWLHEVEAGLATSDDLPPPSLTEEDLKALRALGYLD